MQIPSGDRLKPQSYFEIVILHALLQNERDRETERENWEEDKPEPDQE